ncbi:sensor histidine kinase [Paeniglutamicibacter gangotriensis]|nr:sensor histidine kinase [Paeniglutamicibacter gangotriensis]
MLLLVPFGFAYAILTILLGASLLVTIVGLSIAAAMLIGARSWGQLQRTLTEALLDKHVDAPPRLVRRPGFMGFIRSGLGDASGWRALAHMLVSFATTLVASLLSITFLVTGLGCLTYWYWVQWLPLQQATDGSWHRGTSIGSNIYAEGPTWNLVYVAVGVLFTFLLWPAINNGLARLQGLLAAGLLGPTEAQLRVNTVEEQRKHTVQDADARLAQIERDLHDGTQAQLVAIAMKLGDARDRLADKDIDENIKALLASAQATATDAMNDLRSLASGIRPAVINDGLDTALESLVAAAPMPVSLTYSVDSRPDPAIEAIAYFCAAELLNNAAKHSGGTRITVKVGAGNHGKLLLLSVLDDGVGGVDLAAGSGIEGLKARAANVDGTLDISSPRGGPTEITVSLPLS